MNATCPQCGMGLSFDTGRLPTEPFNVLCPRCRQSVTVMPPPREEPRLPGSPEERASSAGSPAPGDVLRSLTEMMAAALKGQSPPQRAELDKWQRRRMLLCVEDPGMRDRLRARLDPTRYEVFTAESASEASELVSDSRAEVIVLSPGFDPEHQGGGAMMLHVSRLTPQARRRTFVVLLSPQLRTLDTYLAFANGVNLTIHPEDVDSFSSIFERSVRDFNELYRPFNVASGLEPF